MSDDHKHWITVIETDAPDVYDGARIGVCHSKEEAEADVLEWIENYADGDAEWNGHLDTAEKAMAKYTEYTGRHCKIEEAMTMSLTLFKVNVGYDSLGREKNVYYPSLDAAKRAVGDYFRRTKTVLSIVEVSVKPKEPQ